MYVLEALGQLRGNRTKDLTEAPNDHDDLVRIQAAEEIGRSGARRAAPSLRRALNDSSALVRSYVAAALGGIGSASDRTRLEKHLSRETSDSARLGFYEALWLLGDKTVFNDALQLLTSPDYRARSATARALFVTFLSLRTRPRIIAALRRRFAIEPTKSVRSTIRSILSEFD
jgi:HEAT repeat protein